MFCRLNRVLRFEDHVVALSARTRRAGDVDTLPLEGWKRRKIRGWDVNVSNALCVYYWGKKQRFFFSLVSLL